jgi:ABC-type uncharacterized transport system fused permease/ATPase subunit
LLLTQLGYHVCACAVAVAFYNGQKQERESSDKAFESLYWRMRALFKRSFFLIFFVYFQGNIGSAFSLLIVALYIVSNGNLDGKPVTEGTSQSALAAITQLIQALSALPAMYSLAGQLVGITHRCGQLLEALDELQVTLRRRCLVQRRYGRHQESLFSVLWIY